MRIAALYDIHGNLPALDAVLREVDGLGVETLVLGGDVAAGPLPAETIERLRALGSRARCVRGNADREMVSVWDGAPSDPALPEAARAATAWAAGRMDRAQRDFLAAFEDAVVLEVPGLGAVRFCHATPRSDRELFTARTPVQRVAAMMSGVAERLVVCGHTHMPFDRAVGGLRVVNAGSVGMPYGEPGAHWLLLGPGVEPRRTDYDRAAAARIIRASDYPQAAEFADRNVLDPPGAEEVLAVFERMVT